MKTKGNVGPLETQVLESVLYQLRMAVVKGPPSKDEKAGEDEDGKGEGDAPPEKED